MRSIAKIHSDEHNCDLLVQLRQVVRHANRADIRSVPALISKLIGNQNAALMCLRLLYWFPKSRKPDGWVYKSWRDWNAECNLSQGQVKRVHSQGCLESVGITRQIMKANGTPTSHYRLDVNRFVACLADFLDIPEQQVCEWMGEETPPEASQNVPIESVDTTQSNRPAQPKPTGQSEPSQRAEATQSITTLPTDSQQPTGDRQNQPHPDTVVVVDKPTEEHLFQVLSGHGIDGHRARQIINQYGITRVQAVTDKASGQHIHHPAGFILRALEHGWQVSRMEPSTVSIGLFEDGQHYIRGKYADFIQH